jgi:hypothetical protein
MSEQQLNVNNETLTSIKEKLFSGRAAFEPNDLENLYKQFEDELTDAIKNQSISKNDETTREWVETIKSILTGDFADTLFVS